jgi:diketogulonate reductase-like aldo/keto reductase
VGYRHFDLGSVFENEVEIGQLLEGSRCLSIARRRGDRT